MKFIFFGTPHFSARTLAILLEHDLIPEAVVCNPDRPLGRKKIITPPPVKTIVEEWNEKVGDSTHHSIEILQPEKLDEACIEKLRSFEADFFVVFAYNKIFRKNVLGIPRLGTIGIHPSFLPKYRGPSPFQTALLNGEKETGVTLYLLDEGIDSGPIIARSPAVTIDEDETFDSLAGKLAVAGAQLLIAIIPNFVAGNIIPQPQDESQATFTKKFKTEDAFVSEEDLAIADHDEKKSLEIFYKIQAFNPEPGAWTLQNGKRIKLLSATVINGRIKLIETQKEGERPKQL